MGALAIYRGLLSNRPLVWLLAGEFLSGIGNWLYLVALLIVVYQDSADPLLLGVIGGARILPYVALSVPAGIVADRFDRRLVLLVTDAARVPIMVVLAGVVFAGGPVWVVVALAILATCFAPFFYPAIGAYIPSLVRDERELGPANSAASTLDNLAYIVGPVIAGLLVAVADLGWAFLLNAVSFAAIAVILWFLPPSRPNVAEAGAEGASTGAAAKLRRTLLRPLAGLTVADAAASFVLGGVGVLTVVLAVDRLHAGDAGTGYLNAAVGVGGLLGALIAGALVLRPNLLRQLLVGGVAVAIGIAALGLSESMAPALLAIAVASAGGLVMEVSSTTVFQRIVPDEIRGRAIGVLSTFSRLALAAGSFALPALATWLGIPMVLIVSGVGMVVASVIAVSLVGTTGRLAPTDESRALQRVLDLPIFVGVPAPAMEVAAARLRPEAVTVGEDVVRQGDPAERFYIIEAGTFAVDQATADGHIDRLRTLGSGDVFGELGLLRGEPRSATVTALTDGHLLTLDGPEFLELVGAATDLSARLINLYR
jgi:MFS family permease